MTSNRLSESPATVDFEAAQQGLFDAVGLAAKSRFVDLESPPGRLHVFESGPLDERTPVVFVHGGAAFGAFFAPLMAQLPETRTIAFDRPGYGLSDPFEYTEGNWKRTATDVIEGVLDHLGLEQIHLVGHSMGGLASIWFALDRPDRVRRLVTVGAVAAFPGTRLPIPFKLLTVPLLNRFIQWMQKPDEEGVLEIAEIFGEREAFREHPSFIRANATHDADPKSAKAGLSEINALCSLRGWRPSCRLREDELRTLRHPTLLIWGAHDPIGNPGDVRDGVELIPKARFETVGSGHIPYLAHPERCAQLISEMCGIDSSDIA